MKVELMDSLTELEYLQGVADQSCKDGNDYGYETLTNQVNQGLENLGVSRAVARDLGWNL